MNKHIFHINLAKGFRGGERQTELLIRGLAQHDWQQTLITRRQSELGKRCANIPKLNAISTRSNVISAFRQTPDADLIHAHEARAGQVGYLRWLKSRTPYLITRRVDNPIKPSVFTHAMLKHASTLVGLTKPIGRMVKDYEPEVTLKIIPSAYTNLAIDSTQVINLKERYQGKFVIGHIGALDHSHKGQGTLIEVAKRFAQTHPNIHFVLLGDGKDEMQFKQQSAHLNNIEFTGFVDNVGDYLSIFDTFAFPSLHEGLGSILLDALHFGVPIVATRVGGIPDVIDHDQNGLLIEPEDPDALYQALLNLHDLPSLRERLSLNAQHASSDYHVDNMVARYESLYQDILSS